MKKILIPLMLVVLILSGCNEKEKEPEVVENNVVIEEQNIVEETNIEKYVEDKNYFYLVDNELFFTMKNGKIQNSEDSILTLEDILNNKEFINFKDIFSGNAREKTYEIHVAKYNYMDGSSKKKEVSNEELYNDVVSSINSGDFVREEKDISDNWYDTRDENVYRIPAKMGSNQTIDAKDKLGSYGSTIRFDYGFVTNDENLLFVDYIEPTNNLSEKALEYVNNYITANKLKVSDYETVCYAIDLNNDDKDENVYLIESKIARTENGYISNPKKFEQNNMISLLLVEDDGKIESLYSNHTPLETAEKSVYSSDTGVYINDTNICFSDFNNDGNIEMIFAGKALDYEPYRINYLYEFRDGNFERIATCEGPNH